VYDNYFRAKHFRETAVRETCNSSKVIFEQLHSSNLPRFIARASYCYIVRSIEFVIRVGTGTEEVGLFESIHLFVYKLMLQNAISGVEQRARLWLE
jgi:hypothetical protein